MSKDNQGAIFIADFAGKCIREKVMMEKPLISSAYYHQKMELYKDHIKSRRTFPYPVSKEQDGKELREGIDFLITWQDKDDRAIPIEPDTPLQPVKDEGDDFENNEETFRAGLTVFIYSPGIINKGTLITHILKSINEFDEQISAVITHQPFSSPPEPSSKEQEAVGFAEWMDEKQKSRQLVRLKDNKTKWFYNYKPDAKEGKQKWESYTTEQLYQLFKQSTTKP